MRVRVLLRSVLTLVLAFSASAQVFPEKVWPEKDWERAETPEKAGYSSKRLEAARAWVRSIDTTAVMAVAGGRVIFEHGDVKHLSYLASVRKSILAMLYGNYVASGKISLDRTLAALGLTDRDSLLPSEREATVEHLIAARSGVYHPASNPGDATAYAPNRGSQKPGSYFLYNNWDFNAAGAAFEKMTGRDIYDALETDLARPIGMQDFDRALQRKSGDAQRSEYLAYHMWLSTRDMARAGYLMLREGRWKTAQVIPRDWARKIASLATPLAELNPEAQRRASYGAGQLWGYGYMWWVWDAPKSRGPFDGAYTGMGAGGQYITVLPALDLVVAHKTDMQQPADGATAGARRQRQVTLGEYHALLGMIVASRCGENCR
jgi:CubicO group peptidase (beta-lactamase class C family)